MPNAPRKDTTSFTFRCGKTQKKEWEKKAKAAGMSLTLFICYVLDRTNLRVSLTTETASEGPPPRR